MIRHADQRSIALRNPCYLAGECINQMYNVKRRVGPYRLSLTVTVNAGYE